MSTHVAPVLLRKINERRVLELIRRHGPSSRAAVVRASGMTAPTVSKAVASMLRHGFLEERPPDEAAVGRPGKLLYLGTPRSANALGVVIDSRVGWVVAAGFDGRLLPEHMRSFAMPNSYSELLAAIESQAQDLMRHLDSAPRGVGLCVPGLLNTQSHEVVFSPNLHMLDGQRPAIDLSKRLGIQCVMLQESHALCLGERMYGEAQGLDNFAMLDVSTGLGLGVMSGGRFLTGHSGMAGELGHITVDPRGLRCGCGNQGCLETVATDSALARLVSEKVGRVVNIEEAISLIRAGSVDATAEIDQTCESLAIAVAAVINIFNPSTLFVHGRLFDTADNVFAEMVERARRRALKPSFADCSVRQARGSKRQGSIAGIIQHLTDSWAPAIS